MTMELRQPQRNPKDKVYFLDDFVLSKGFIPFFSPPFFSLFLGQKVTSLTYTVKTEDLILW